MEKAQKNLLKEVNLKGYGRKTQGKVRDFYIIKGIRILITTDRISAFDRVLGYIPYKGQVLNELSKFWFDKTKDIIPNHCLAFPHPNVTIARDSIPYPVEMVVRGFITGVTSTSIWRAYELGERNIYGFNFPEGLKKNQILQKPLITPTTKAIHGAHDERITHSGILKKKLVPPTLLFQMEEIALKLFKRGQEICKKRGLILVDTKYEFGSYKGKLILIDEIHTPDSSRFWKADTYLDRFKKGIEPENFDKEFFRLWYAKKGYRGDGNPPRMAKDLQIKTSLRYIKIYEMVTGKKLKLETYPLQKKIDQSINNYFRSN